eukprot:TRINITY_DN3079_c0_g1_i3.p1 TRINITY_DN3079_c0_g1~~TRINITY_DN3079_c0_g1_i3.p1  ORF type:complete len:319 (-),score=35.18 TRINITY_DN3079_c0_g1_i3:141-1097(-)
MSIAEQQSCSPNKIQKPSTAINYGQDIKSLGATIDHLKSLNNTINNDLLNDSIQQSQIHLEVTKCEDAVSHINSNEYLMQSSKPQEYYRKNQIPITEIPEPIKQILQEQKLAIQQNQFRKVDSYLIELLSKSVDANDLDLFTYIIQFLAQLAYDMKQYNYAIFYFNQLRLVSVYTKQFSTLLYALIWLGKSACESRFYTQSLKLFKKALQFAWYLKNQEKELEVYEELGKDLFYLGILDQSLFLHERFAQCLIETDESPVKKYSLEITLSYLNQVGFQTSMITSLLLTYLQLPLLTEEQMPNLCATQKNYINLSLIHI